MNLTEYTKLVLEDDGEGSHALGSVKLNCLEGADSRREKRIVDCLTSLRPLQLDIE